MKKRSLISKNNKSALKWILKNSKAQTANIILLVIFYALYSFIGVYTALISKELVDSAVLVAKSGTEDMSGVIFYAVFFLVAIVLQLLLRVMSNRFAFRAASKLEISLKNHLFSEIIKKDYSKITCYHSGELLNRLTSDISVVSNCITTILPNLVFFLVQISGAFILLCKMDYVLALVFLFGGIIVLLIAQLFKPKMKKMHKKCQETDGKTRSYMQEIIANLLVIKVFESSDKVCDECNNYQSENYKAKSKRNAFSIATSTAMMSVFSLGHLFCLVWGCFKIALYGMSYGTLTAILSLVTQIQTPIKGLSSVFSTYYQALASAERIMEIEQIEKEANINEFEIDVAKTYESLKSIEFSNITFGYDKEIVLDNASVVINKGDFVAVTGESGIGKSTLIKLLLSVYNLDSGEVFINLNNGEKTPVDKYTRKMFAYVPQGNFLLSGTIRDNISFINPEADDKKIMQVADICCAREFIDELSDGLDSVIGEKGHGLSEGQIQRIAIARAILSDAPIILLDEATSALDVKTEERLLNNLKNLTDKTCIMVSHKNAANAVCNREIRVVDKKIKAVK